MSTHNHVKDFQTYVIDSPIIKTGKFSDKSGKTLELSSDDVASIFNDVNNQVELIDVHDGKEVIGRVQKYTLRNDGIYAKILITNPGRFDAMRKNGFDSISPEISIDRHEHSISASLDKLALSCNPGMIKEPFMTEVLKFDSPQAQVGELIANDSWKEPLGEISKKLNELNDKFMTNNPPTQNTPPVQTPIAQADPNQVTMSKEDLSALIRSSIEEYAKANAPKVESPPEIKPENETTSNIKPEVPAEVMDKLNKVSNEYENLLKKQKADLIVNMKSLGIADPEKLVVDSGLDLSQQIAMLERVKDNFARNTPLDQPMNESISNTAGSSGNSNAITIDALLDSEAFEATNDPQLRHRLMRLSDPDLMRQYNMNVLFDQNGNYIGPNY